MPRHCILASLLAWVGANGALLQEENIQVGHLLRKYWVQYPSGTEPPAGWPLVLSFHGWMSNAGEMAGADNFRRTGAESALVVHGEGLSDPTAPGWIPADRWKSWNGGGSSGEEAGGVDGPICKPAAVDGHNWQCYASCKAKGYCTGSGKDNDRCRWSHCEDDVAFVVAVVKHLTAYKRVDPSRVYATGHSNGGTFMYELASDPRSASIFAAIAPVSGLPHNGFNRGTPNLKMRFLDIGGTQDTFVWHYPNVLEDGSKSYGNCCGWYYSNWQNTSSLWATQKGYVVSDRRDITNKQPDLSCQGWSPDGTAEKADIAVCFYNGGHLSPETVWKLVWDFFDLPVSAGQAGPSAAVKLVFFVAVVGAGLLKIMLYVRGRTYKVATA